MSGDSVIVRSATPADAAALIEFLRAFRGEGHPGVFRPTRPLPTLEQEVAWIQSFIDYDGAHLWVACSGDRVVGILDFHGHRHPQMMHGGALGTSVLRAFRGQGIGFELMQTLIAWATAHQTLSRIELEVFSSNTHAIDFYARQGFIREGARKGAVVIEGAFEDIVLMARPV